MSDRLSSLRLTRWLGMPNATNHRFDERTTSAYGSLTPAALYGFNTLNRVLAKQRDTLLITMYREVERHTLSGLSFNRLW
jgi:hypothetical protein